VILDTNALSAIADGDPAVAARIAGTRVIAVPVIVLGEYGFGISQYERWLAKFLTGCRVLEISAETAIEYAEVRSELKRGGTPIPSNDAWIAALCRQHSLPILSQDEHFDSVKAVQRQGW